MATRPTEIRRATLDTCPKATGAVVVVDVLRAFTTAAFAFDRGASEILLVSTVEEAFGLRDRHPDCLLLGEVNGLPIDGFDLPNSPAAIAALDTDLFGRRLIMRTSAGTQGVVRSARAAPVFVASLCVASATAARLRELRPESVTFVETGVRPDGGGEEDAACADTIAGLLVGDPPDPAEVERRVLGSGHAALFASPEYPDFPRADLDCALEIDRFLFAMQVNRAEGLFVLTAVR